MSPVLAQLLEDVGCAPARQTLVSERLAIVVERCARFVGHINTQGLTPYVPLVGREIAELAAKTLPTQLAVSFAPLASIERTLSDRPDWGFADVSAHISHIARLAVQRSEA